MTIPKKKLSDSELEIMLAVWDAGRPITGSEILQQIRQKRTWALSTLMTVLTRLVEKGYLACDRSTRNNLYSPLVGEEEYKEEESRSFLHRMYGNSLPSLISCLYKSGAIGDKDLEELQDFLDQAQKEE